MSAGLHLLHSKWTMRIRLAPMGFARFGSYRLRVKPYWSSGRKNVEPHGQPRQVAPSHTFSPALIWGCPPGGYPPSIYPLEGVVGVLKWLKVHSRACSIWRCKRCSGHVLGVQLLVVEWYDHEGM